jgi:hypothetical protein
MNQDSNSPNYTMDQKPNSRSSPMNDDLMEAEATKRRRLIDSMSNTMFRPNPMQSALVGIFS